MPDTVPANAESSAVHPEVATYLATLPAEVQTNQTVQQLANSGVPLQTFMSGLQGIPEVQTQLANSAAASQQAPRDPSERSDALKAIGNGVFEALQGQKLDVENPSTKETETYKFPISNVVADISASKNGDQGEQSFHLEFQVPHGFTDSYAEMAKVIEQTLQEKLPTLATLQRGSEGSWKKDDNYALEFKIPAELPPVKLEEALLQELKLSRAAESGVMDTTSKASPAPEQVADQVVAHIEPNADASGAPGFARPELLKKVEPTSIKPEDVNMPGSGMARSA